MKLKTKINLLNIKKNKKIKKISIYSINKIKKPRKRKKTPLDPNKEKTKLQGYSSNYIIKKIRLYFYLMVYYS
jgi:hypothetical protein